MTEQVHKTVFEVTVFSRGPFSTEGGDLDPFDLKEINYAITEGDCIGWVEQVASFPVPNDRVKEELVAIGNDGTFFESDWDLGLP